MVIIREIRVEVSVSLVTILLVTVSILIVLSGVAVFVGSKKTDKVSSAFFLLATVFGALWAVSIAAFLALSPERVAMAPVVLVGVYTSALFLDTCLVGHAAWKYKAGRVFTGLFGALGLANLVVMLFKHEVLYTEIVLSYEEGNRIIFTEGWFRWAYLGFFSLITFVLLGFLLYRAIKSTNEGHRMGLLVFIIGLSFTGVVSLVFDLLLTYWVTYKLIWVGPLTMAATILAYYYAIIRYRVITLDTRWLKTLSYVIILASMMGVYALIFFGVFSALFRTSTPSAAVFLLNAIMVGVALVMVPAVGEITAFLRSLIQTDRIDLSYVVKKLERMQAGSLNMRELSGFLADHLHFLYVGIVLDKKMYGSSEAGAGLSSSSLSACEKFSAPKGSVWVTMDKAVKSALAPVGASAVAELRGEDGKKIGVVVFGKASGKVANARFNQIQMEMVLKLVAELVK